MSNPNPHQFNRIQPIPGVLLWARVKNIRIGSIPALAAIAGSKVKNAAPSDTPYSPSRTLYLTKNEDGSYAVLNCLELIEADIARIAAKWVTAHVLRSTPDQDEPISLLRTFLATVEPARRCISVPQLLAEIFKGKLDKLAYYYSATQSKPGAWGMYRRLFSNNELPKSTFYRPKGGNAKDSSKTHDPESHQASDIISEHETTETDCQKTTKARPALETELTREDKLPVTDRTAPPQYRDKKANGEQRDLFDQPT